MTQARKKKKNYFLTTTHASELLDPVKSGEPSFNLALTSMSWREKEREG